MGERTLTIIQPGRLGDLIITLPIAYHYHFEKGFKIIWPVCSEYVSIFKYVNFPIYVYDIGTINKRGAESRLEALNHIDFEYLDLAIGFGDSNLDQEWRGTHLSFDLWKYHKAKVDYNEKYRLVEFIKRNMDKEEDLMLELGVDYESDFFTVHENGSHGRHFDFSKSFFRIPDDVVRINQIEGYSIFDWLTVLENSSSIFCVDSSMANLVDQWKIRPPEGKHFHKWTEYYTDQQIKLLTPNLSENWTIVT